MTTGTTQPGDAAVFGLIARLADNKYFLGQRYAEWCSSAPTLESSAAAAAMAQDELGHARAIYPLLRALAPQAGPEIDPETRTDFLAVPFLAHSFMGWPDFVAANFLFDPAMTLVFAAAQHSTYEPLAGRSRKVMQEERRHALHGEGWVRQLARDGGAVRAALEHSLRRVWAEALCWLGPAGVADPLVAAGVLDAAPDALRERLLALVGPVVEDEGVHLPLRRAGKGWELTEPLPWERWDAHTYQLAPVTQAAHA